MTIQCEISSVLLRRLSEEKAGPVAQWLEQRTHNPLVLGSNPSRPTKVY